MRSDHGAKRPNARAAVVTVSGLPQVLHEIAEVAGREAAFRVAAAKGGRVAYFPREPGPDHWLSEIVGHDTAIKIGKVLATGQVGATLLVPMGPREPEVVRWRRLRELVDSGVSESAIAEALGMHVRSVQYHKAGRLKRVEFALAQGDLFEGR